MPPKIQVWDTWDDQGNTYVIYAPASATEAQVNKFAADNYRSWTPGGHYDMVPGPAPDQSEPGQDFEGATPEAVDEEKAAAVDEEKAAAQSDLERVKTRNQLQDEAVAKLDQDIARVEGELYALTQARTMNPGRAALLGGTGLQTPSVPTEEDKARFAMSPAERKDQVTRKQAELKFLRAEREKRVIGHKGGTYGGMGGAVGGAVLGGAIGNVPGAAIGAIIGGALGTAAGTALYDIPEARKARDITDAEAHDLIRQRAIESVIYDGAFMLVFGPGGRLIGKMVKGSKFIPALKAAARESFAWQDIKNAGVATRNKVVQDRAKLAQPGMASQASDKLGLPARGTAEELNEDLVRTVTRKAGGRVPTPGEMQGVVTSTTERLARSQSPTVFTENDKVLAQTAEDIRDHALAALDRAGAVTGPELGNAINSVRESAEATMKSVTGPIFERAAREGSAANMAEARKFLDEAVAEITEAAGANVTPGELRYLVRLQRALTKNPIMRMRAAQNLDSGLKNMMRGLSSETQPSDRFKDILGDLIGKVDEAYLKGVAGAADPTLRKELLKARQLYKATMKDLYADTMVRLAAKTPEDLGQALIQKGGVTEIQELRAALLRAQQNAMKKQRVKITPGGPKVLQLSTEQIYEMRQKIDAGMIKSFLEQNTQSLKSLSSRLDDPKFRLTLKELLVGKNAANPALGKQVLADLDKTLGVLKLIKPELAPQPGRIGPAGLGAIGLGTAIGGVFGTGISLSTVGIAGALYVAIRMLGKATAKALTRTDRGMLRAIQRVIRLAPAAHKLGGQYGAAGSAFQAAVYELDTWDRQTGGTGFLQQPDAGDRNAP